MRWDYTTVVLTHGTLGFHRGELNRRDFEDSLDELGREGYELVWILMDEKLHGEKDGHVLIFKRPAETSAQTTGTPRAVGE